MLQTIRRLFTPQATEQPFQFLPTLAKPRATFRVSRGIIEQIATPLIDESDSVQVMRLRKFLSELESQLGRYGFFSICEVRDFIHDFKIPLTSETAQSYQLLQSMHCVSFKIMPADLYAKIPHLINHVISGGQITHPLIGGAPVVDV